MRQVANDRAGSRARTAFDLTHNAVIHFVYEIPLGKNLKGPAGVLFKGWQTNGILSLRSGFPWTPTVGFNDLNTGVCWFSLKTSPRLPLYHVYHHFAVP